MYYAYIRVSTDHQNVENQKFEILTYCQKHNIQIDKWIDEAISSRKPLTERKLGKLLKKLKKDDILKFADGNLEDENGRIEITEIGEALFYPRESPLVNALYKAYVDVTGDTENEPMVIGGGTYAKSLKNIIAFGPEKLGVDYRIHGADEYILVSEMEEAVEIYMEAIKNLLAI